MRDQIEEAVELGRANAQAQALLANHCVHARVSVRVSDLGRAVRLPIGPAEIACEHAPFFGKSTIDLTSLAVDFYEQNCTQCKYRTPNGRVPTIASEAERRRQEVEKREAATRAALQSEHDAWRNRRDQREASVLGQGYPVRDLAERIGEMDCEPGVDADAHVADRAATRVLELARQSPELFNGVLLGNVLALAEDLNPNAYPILRALTDNDVLEKSRVVEIAARAMGRSALPQAAEIVASFGAQLEERHVAICCASAIRLASAPDVGFGAKPQPRPDALLALARVSEETVLRAVIDALGADDDWARHAGADASWQLICDSPRRFDHLAAPLLRSIHGKDAGYAGDPYPASAAVRAIAAALVSRPAETCNHLERIALALNEEARTVLAGLAQRVLRKKDGELSDDALTCTLEFLARRLSCDWGSEAANEASDDLRWAACEFPRAVARLTDTLIGALLRDSQSPPTSSLSIPTGTLLEAMENDVEQMRTRRRLSDISKALGEAARHSPTDVLPRVFAFLEAESGDGKADLRLRRALTSVLEHACAPETLSRILPWLYSLLLSPEQALRASAVSLWAAFAREAKVMPDQLESLATTLLSDPYNIVHGRMTEVLPRLRLSDDTARKMVVPLITIARAHGDDDTEIVKSALDALLWAIERYDAETKASVYAFVVSMSGVLSPLDRERLLLRANLDSVRPSAAWASAALQTFADRRKSGFEILPRRDSLLECLLGNAQGLTDVPFARFLEIAEARGPSSPMDAAEMIELLQASGRWKDAHDLAVRALAAIPRTEEFKSRRQWLARIAIASEAERLTFEGSNNAGIAPDFGISEDNEPWHITHARARSQVRGALLATPVEDPAGTSELIVSALQKMDEAEGGDSRVDLFPDVLRVVVELLRCDAAVRSANGHLVQATIESVHRNAAVFRAKALRVLREDDVIVEFFVRAQSASVQEIDELIGAARAIPLALPLCDRVLPRHRREKATPEPVGVAAEPVVSSESIVCVLQMNGKMILDTQVLQPETAYALALDIRRSAWPAWADGCRVEFLSTLPPDSIALPTFEFARNDVVGTERGILLSKAGNVIIRAGRIAGAPPLEFPLHAYFYSSDGRHEVCDVVGYERLLLRPYDPSRDKLTSHVQMDERLLEMYAELYEDPTLNQNDVSAFCRFFTACVQSAQRLMFDFKYLSGKPHLSEREFHDDLEQILLEDPDLKGCLTRGERLAGGFHDLLHENIAAELKVEKKTARTIENAARYIGQPTQYGVGRGSRLSILVVLDQTKKTVPPAVLENHIGWLYPKQHGLDDPRYPSRVGVLIINANWPTPSRWSRRRIETRERA